MLDIIYLDNYNKIVFECKKCILQYITYIQTRSDKHRYLKCIFMTGMQMKLALFLVECLKDLFWAQHFFLCNIKRHILTLFFRIFHCYKH